MKKILVIAAIAMALSATASFATGRIEIRTRPQYDQDRADQLRADQLRADQQRADQVRADRRDAYQLRADRRRAYQLMLDQRRHEWQRNQWENDRSARHNRQQSAQTYDQWLREHRNDYDTRPNQSAQQSYEAYERSLQENQQR